MSKYHSIKKEVDGIKFASTKEADYYIQLKLRKKAGDIKDFKLQPRFDYCIIYCQEPSVIEYGKYLHKTAFYKADFAIIHNDGSVEIIDVKGCKTATYKQKKKIIEALYDIKIIEK